MTRVATNKFQEQNLEALRKFQDFFKEKNYIINFNYAYKKEKNIEDILKDFKVKDIQDSYDDYDIISSIIMSNNEEFFLEILHKKNYEDIYQINYIIRSEEFKFDSYTENDIIYESRTISDIIDYNGYTILRDADIDLNSKTPNALFFSVSFKDIEELPKVYNVLNEIKKIQIIGIGELSQK